MDSPLAWVGGKRILRKQIIPLIPADHTCYVEVFAGGSWVLFGKEKSKVEVLNDKDGELINFYNIVLKHPDEFFRQARQLVISRKLFEILKTIEVEFMTDIERAVRFYYLLKLAFGAKRTGQNFGIFISHPPKWNHGTSKSRFRAVAERLKGVIIECLNFADLIERYDRPWTVFYCDPPYIGTTQPYDFQFQQKDHECLSGVLKGIKGRFILSYNDHPDVWRMYKKFNFRQVEGHYSVSRESDGRRSFGELIVTNF